MGGEGDEYTLSQMVAGKSTKHLQSERWEPLVASVGKIIDMLQLQMVWLHRLGRQGLRGEMPEVVAQGNSNMVELHREVQDEVAGPRRSWRNVLRHFLLELGTRRGLKREPDMLNKSLMT